MRKLIAWDMITLNGIFAGSGDDLSWFAFDDELERYILETQMAAGMLLFGRVTYDMMAAYWSTEKGRIADFMNSVPKVVFSRTLKEAPPWNNTRLVRDGVAEEVAKMKAEEGEDIFVFGSADFTATLIQNGLIDEYRFGINPVVLAQGRPMFTGGFERIDLRLLEARPLKSGLILLHYAPAAKA